MQLLFTVSVAILCVEGSDILNQFKGTCVSGTGAPLFCDRGGTKYPGGPCSTGAKGTNTRNTCVGEPCGSESCDPRAKLDGTKGAQFCCTEAAGSPKCVDWDADGANCKADGPVNRVPKCELIDAKTVSGATPAGQSSPNDNDASATTLKYSQILNDGYHWCPHTQQCEKLMTDATTGQTSICPNWDKWVFRPAKEGGTCTVGGDDMDCPSAAWADGNLASFSLGVKTTGKYGPSVQCGGTYTVDFPATTGAGAGYEAKHDVAAAAGVGGCAKGHLWYYRVEYPNKYVDQWEFCDSGPEVAGQTGSSLAWRKKKVNGVWKP